MLSGVARTGKLGKKMFYVHLNTLQEAQRIKMHSGRFEKERQTQSSEWEGRKVLLAPIWAMSTMSDNLS